jgi:UDP-GlcNAc:undecaprenyl-phosphate GlcNAc-1-phosphate transferase
MYITLALLAVFAFLLALALTPLCRAACNRLGWVDQPGIRKVHLIAVPRTGGIAIFVSYAAALTMLLLLPQGTRALGGALPGVLHLLPAVLVVFFTGLLDDILGLKPWMKMTGLIAAGALACLAGVQIRSIAGLAIAGAWWHTPLTIVWLVGCANAFNLIDGIDGLAAGVGLFATGTALLSGLLNGNLPLVLVTAPLFGALLGFLFFNFSPASIFMGDSGSLTVGFLLGCFGVIWSQKSATLLGMTAPLVALSIPLFETALSIARRFLRNQHIFGADRGHIHHRLLARGLTVRRAVFVVYVFAGLLAGLSLLLCTRYSLRGAALVAFCALVWLAVQYLGYEEFDAARRIIFGGLFHRMLNASLSVRQLENAVKSAHTLDECWAALQVTCRNYGFCQAALYCNGRKFTSRFAEVAPEEYWSFSVPLNNSGHIDLCVPFGSAQPPVIIGTLAASLRTAFAAKTGEFLSHLTVERNLARVGGQGSRASGREPGPLSVGSPRPLSVGSPRPLSVGSPRLSVSASRAPAPS